MRQAKLLLMMALMVIIKSPASDLFARQDSPTPSLKVSMNTVDDAVYPKSRLRLKMTFVNEGTTPVTLDGAAFAMERFRIVDAKGRGPGKMLPGIAAPEPIRVDGLETVEHEVDLSAWYPSITSKKRAWEITWSHGELRPAPLTVKIIRPYDPRKDTEVSVETDLGPMVWRLLPEHAPDHVKHFVDLVRHGFYDGLTIYRATPGLIAEGGDPNGDGTGGWNRLLMPEVSRNIEMKMGLVGALRRESSVTNEFIFFITLGPNDYMAGMQTFFAEVVSGIQVVALLHRAPSHGESQDDKSYMLTPPIKIHRMTVGS